MQTIPQPDRAHNISVLIASERRATRKQVASLLTDYRCSMLDLSRAASVNKAIADAGRHAAVIIDLDAGGKQAGNSERLNILASICAEHPRVAVIALLGNTSAKEDESDVDKTGGRGREAEDVWAEGLEAIRYGAQDCLLTSELSTDRLKRSLVFAVERQQYEPGASERQRGTSDWVFLEGGSDNLPGASAVLSAVLEGVDAGITVYDGKGKRIYANETAARILGYDSADDLLKTPREELYRRFEIFDEEGDIIPPERRPSNVSLSGVLLPPQLIRMRNLVNEDQYWSVSKSIPIRDRLGHVTYVVNIFSDLTRSKDSEAARRLSEQLFARAFHLSPVALWISDLAEGKAIDVNDRFLQMIGHKREDVIGQTTLSLGLWSNVQERKRLIEQIEHHGPIHDRQFSFRRAPDELRYGLISADFIDYYGGRCLLVACRDITEHKRESEELALYAGRVTTMNELARRILEGGSTQAIASAALRYLRQLVPCTGADILLVDLRGNRSVVLAADSESLGTDAGLAPGKTVPLRDFDSSEEFSEGKVMKFDSERRIVKNGRWASRKGSYVSVPLVLRGQLFGALNVRSRFPGAFNATHIDLIYEVAYDAAMGIQNSLLIEQVQTGNEQLQRLSQRVLEIQEQDRQHIARELHDEIGQALTAVKISLDGFKRQPNAGRMELRVEESVNLVTQALRQVRDLSHDLRPSLLDDLGLVSALNSYVNQVSKRTELDISLEVDPFDARFDAEIEVACFRIAQEALTNVIRHAGARQVWVSLKRQDDGLLLTVGDDGVGFDVAAIREGLVGRSSLGLLGMYERAQLLRGRITIVSEPGHGCLVRAYLPLAK